MKVECEDDMDYTPTNRPRPTGEMTEGPDGETNGMTDDGMTEDPNGVTGGTCKCGMKKTTRIVGGSETEVNEYPWIASFDFSGVNGQNPGGCAATLIANNWAVSASHCFFDPSTGERSVYADTMSLVLGVHDRTGGTDTNRKVLAIEEIILHPSYVYTGNSYDIALFKLAESVDLDVWSPACLPDQGADYTGQNGWVYGWGVTSENGANLADKLLELEVPIVSDSVCASAMSSVSIGITSDMLCAGGEDGKKAVGTCKTAEANAVEGIDSCKERTKCGGAKDKEDAARRLAALTPLNDALKRKEMENAMTSAGVASGPGADGQTPTSRSFVEGWRTSRDGAGCLDLAQQWTQFNTSASKAAGSANGDLTQGRQMRPLQSSMQSTAGQHWLRTFNL